MEKQFREKRLVAASSVLAAIFLTGTKLAIGLWTGSLGILAEAAHSALDLAAAVITFFAVTLTETTRQAVLSAKSGQYAAWTTRHAVPLLPKDVRDMLGKPMFLY